MNQQEEFVTFALGCEPGTFSGELLDGTFSQEHLAPLLEAMYGLALSAETTDSLPRPVAAAFRFAEQILDDLRFSHALKDLDEEYVSSLREAFMLLAGWYFDGICPFREPETFLAELHALCSN